MDKERKAEIGKAEKEHFKLLDFFANCEYFEEKFNYDEVLKLPVEPTAEAKDGGDNADTRQTIILGVYENFNDDPLKTMEEFAVGSDGMKIDRKLFERFEDRVKSDSEIKRMVEHKDFAAIEDYIVGNIFDKPNDYYNLDKLRKPLKMDRRVGLREIIVKIFNFIPYLKTKTNCLRKKLHPDSTQPRKLAGCNEMKAGNYVCDRANIIANKNL